MKEQKGREVQRKEEEGEEGEGMSGSRRVFPAFFFLSLAHRKERSKRQEGMGREGGKEGDQDVWGRRAPRPRNTRLTEPKCLLTILLDSPLPLLSIYGPPV